MYEAFVKLVNSSIAASVLVLVVLALRLALRRAPKWTRCLLWALVAVQLLCPVRMESDLSVYNLAPASLTDSGETAYVRYNGKTEKPSIVWQTPAPAELPEEPAGETAGAAAAQPASGTVTHTRYLPPLVIVWAAGAAAMLLYALGSFLHLRRKTAAALHLQKNVFLCDGLPSPFILGVFWPKIFLPSELNDAQRAAVLAHERAHLARLDQVWKPLGFLLLSVHWFNPLLWLAYILLCRDIELACDEAVIRTLSAAEKQDYSRTLLQCSLPRHLIAACPLAFGEAGVKTRIKAILGYKKPAFWVVFAAVLAILAAAACFLTQPKRAKSAQDVIGAEGWSAETDCSVRSDTYDLQHLKIDLPGLLDGVTLRKTNRMPHAVRTIAVTTYGSPSWFDGDFRVSQTQDGYSMTINGNWYTVESGEVQVQALMALLDSAGNAESTSVAGTYRMGESRYMNPLSSASSPSGDDGKTYLIEAFEDAQGEQLRLSVIDDETGLEGSFETSAPWRDLDADGAPTWASFFPDGFYPEFVPSIDGCSLRQVRFLSGNIVLFRMDTELWLGRLWGSTDGALIWCAQMDKSSDAANLYAITVAVRARQQDAIAQLQALVQTLTQDDASAVCRYYEEGQLRSSGAGSLDAALAARLTGADWSVIAQEDALSTVWEFELLSGDGRTLRFWERSDDVLLQTADGSFWFHCAREDSETPLGDALSAWYSGM